MRVLFVCLGNICRSPAAEGIFRKKVEEKGLSHLIQCDSAGTSAHHEGESADLRMMAHAKDRGYDLTSVARGFRPETDFEDFDLILTMDPSNYRNVMRWDLDQRFKDKVVPMTSLCKIHSVTEVPDPYYGGDDGFRLVLDILEDACDELLLQIQDRLK